MNNLLLKQLETGPMQNFIYFVGDHTTKDVAIIDPAWDVQGLLNIASKENLNIKAILVTHGHFDHTNGIEEILKELDIPIYVNEKELDFFKFKWGKENIKQVKSGDKLKFGNIEISFIHTPGHTPGSQCFLTGNNLLSGDTLFINSCGRCDLPGSDANQMFDTINRLMKMDDNTVIYPGHNYAEITSDKLLNQKKTNPYMQFDNLHSFIDKRLPQI